MHSRLTRMSFGLRRRCGRPRKGMKSDNILLQTLEKRYYTEIDLREKLESRLSAPLTIIALELGFLSRLEMWYQAAPWVPMPATDGSIFLTVRAPMAEAKRTTVPA